MAASGDGGKDDGSTRIPRTIPANNVRPATCKTLGPFAASRRAASSRRRCDPASHDPSHIRFDRNQVASGCHGPNPVVGHRKGLRGTQSAGDWLPFWECRPHVMSGVSALVGSSYTHQPSSLAGLMRKLDWPGRDGELTAAGLILNPSRSSATDALRC